MKNTTLELCQFSGYGHYKIGIMFRGKLQTTVTNNMPAIDNYNSEEGEKNGRRLRTKEGYESLRAEIIRKNDLK